MHKQRLGILIAAICGMGAIFLPWVNAPFIGSLPGTAGNDGWIAFGFFGIAFLLPLTGDRRQALNNVKKITAIVAGGIVGLIAILKVMDFRETISMSLSNNPFASAFAPAITIGVGLYVTIGAALAIGIVGLFLNDPPNK